MIIIIIILAINKVIFTDDTAIISIIQDELHDIVNILVDSGNKYGMKIIDK